MTLGDGEVMQFGKGKAATSGICLAEADRIEVRGRDLTSELMGRIGFTEYFYLLLTGREASEPSSSTTSAGIAGTARRARARAWR